jgi:hypothetical protein
MVNVGHKVSLRRKQRTTRAGLRRLYAKEPPSFKLSGKREPFTRANQAAGQRAQSKLNSNFLRECERSPNK